ncbi:uncharacterized protein BDW43DRAFT_264728, partial [Aspergillus alliaceus]|uniref:uncharacterized protein n=1 Tax=Petromyces alliaceus TaxID=209559 RepID=UPI0012A490F9
MMHPEFEELIACEETSFNHPPQSIFRFFYPIFGTEPEEDKQTALKNLVQLQRQWSRDDPDAVWCKVVDIEQNDKIVGGILFKVHRDNPFVRHGSGSAQQSATWYPAGSQREYIDECLRMLTAPHERFMQRAYVYAYIGFVLP